MYSQLLIPTDGSELAHKAVAEGLALAKRLNAAFVTATPIWSAMDMANQARRGHPHPVDELEEREANWANDVLDACKQDATKAGLDCNLVHARDKQPAEGIIDTAEKRGRDLIVMSSHGRGDLGQLLLASVAIKVLTHSKIPVLLCR